MIDSIYIASSGLKGFQTGLQNISANTTNLNTPGFKGSDTQFADMFYSQNQAGEGDPGTAQAGLGLQTLGTTIDFSQGQFQATNNVLDLAVNGQGYFVVKDSNGNIHYTADGEFKFNSDGTLVSSTTNEAVMALDSSGNLTSVSLNNLGTSAAKATSTVTFTGNLSSTATTDTISDVTVIDNAGTSHTLTLSFAPVTGSSGSWTATLKDGTTTVGSGTIAFSSGEPVSGSDTVALSYTPSGGTAVALTLDFSSNVTSFDSGTSSTLAVNTQDGYAAGTLTKETFDSTGTMVLTYSNGQTAKSSQLALAQFSSPDDVVETGSNEFNST